MIYNDNEFVSSLLDLGYVEKYESDADDCGGVLCIVSEYPYVENPESMQTKIDHIRGYNDGCFIGATDEKHKFVFMIDNNGNPVDASYYKDQIAELTKT